MSQTRETESGGLWALMAVGSLGGVLCAMAGTVDGARGLAIALVVLSFALVIGMASVKPIVLLVAFAVLLPFHFLVMLLLFNAGLDHGAIRAFSTWKEAIALGLLGVLMLRQLAAGKWPRPRPLDGFVLAFFLINLLYMLFPFTSPISVPFDGRVQGFRDNTFFVILYFIGRLAVLSVSHLRFFAAAVIARGGGGVIAGIYERFALPLEFFFDPLHLDVFVRDYFNMHFYTGIPYNFWTSVWNVRRGVSFHLGSHHFAMASVMLFPLVVGLRRPLRPFPEALRMPLLVLFTIGLALPLTRSVMLACLIQVLLIGWFTKRPHYVLSAVLSVMLLLGISLAFLDLAGYFQGVTARSSSVATHLASWEDTRAVIRDYPLGVGFGVADTVAERAGGTAGVIAGEGEYAFTVTAVGIPGLAVFLLMQASAAWTLLQTWRRAPGTAMRQLALITLAVFVGYALVGSLTQVRHVPAFLFPLWWLVGTVTSGTLEGDDDGQALA